MDRYTRRRSQGQSLTEYGLVEGLIAVSALGAMLFLGSQLSGLFNTMMPGKTTTLQATGSLNGGTSMGSFTGTTFPMAITLSSGKQLTVNMPTSLHEQVLTAGVNGTTSTLLADFTSVVKQLATSGDLAPEQATSLTELANQGYRIVQIEKLLEQTVATASNSATLIDNQIQFEGKPYTLEQLSEMIGTPLNHSKYSDPLNQGADSNPETEKFINLYAAAKASGAMSNPQVENYVNLLASEVATLSEATEDSVAGIIYFERQPQDLATLQASYISAMDSGSICQAGAGSVTGQTCTP